MQTNASVKSLFAVSAVALVALTAPAANATLFSSTFGNVTFNITATNGASSFTFEILNADNANNNNGAGWTGIGALAGFDFKDLGIDFSQAGTTASAFYNPSGPTFPGTNQQISAGLCGTGAPPGSVCFGGTTYPGLALAITHDMTFTITIGGGQTLNIVSATGPHLQIAFEATTTSTDKQGSLYSQNIPASSSTTSSTGGPSGSGTVPEPSSTALALLGVALLGITFLRRRHGMRS